MGSCSEWTGGELGSLWVLPGLIKGCELLEVKALLEVLRQVVITIIY